MSEIKRKLATLRTIKSVDPIENADKIVSLTFESCGWRCITNIDTDPKPGDQRIYFEVDSCLPSTDPRFAFMESDHFRVRTRKFRGSISQGLTMPISDFPELQRLYGVVVAEEKGGGSFLDTAPIEELPDGYDFTDVLGVTKYELPESTQIGGDAKGPFPGFIEKTDEERAQNLEDLEQLLGKHEFDVTVKMDGTSGTFYLYNGEFGVCSRNLELKDTPDNVFWKMARKYNIEARMRAFVEKRAASNAEGAKNNFAIQGEVAGPGVQGNRAGLSELQLFVFTVQDLDHAKRLSNKDIAEGLHQLSTIIEGDNASALQTVPIVDTTTLPAQLKTLNDVAALSEGNCVITDKTREGIVLRAKDDPSISMKYINPRYLLKHDL